VRGGASHVKRVCEVLGGDAGNVLFRGETVIRLGLGGHYSSIRGENSFRITKNVMAMCMTFIQCVLYAACRDVLVYLQ